MAQDIEVQLRKNWGQIGGKWAILGATRFSARPSNGQLEDLSELRLSFRPLYLFISLFLSFLLFVFLSLFIDWWID